jgi:hypothetical protein
VAVASAGGNAGYELDIDVDFELILVDRMKKPAAKGTNDNVYKEMSCSRMIPRRTMPRMTWSTIVWRVQGDGGVLF